MKTARLHRWRHWLAGLFALLGPALAAADITNTASVSYRSPDGTSWTQRSNTVLIALENPPVITGFTALPATLTLQDSIGINISGVYDGVTWTVTPQAAAAAASRNARATADSVTYSLSTQNPVLRFADIVQLSAGAWHIEAVAHNSAGSSAPAKLDVFITAGGSGKSARVWPNPWRKDLHAGRSIIFDQLPDDCSLLIFTVSGHLVRDLGRVSNQATWDLKNAQGDRVGSGLYVYLLTTPDGNKARGKLAIIQ